jgi:hypothetical protein
MARPFHRLRHLGHAAVDRFAAAGAALQSLQPFAQGATLRQHAAVECREKLFE